MTTENFVLPIIKKRFVNKSKLRVKKSSDEDDEGTETIPIRDIKQEQNFRKRRGGIDLDNISKSVSNENLEKGEGVDVGRMMNVQFSNQAQGINEGPVAHQKIMEAYVSEKLNTLLGISKATEDIPLTEEDKLYKIPEEIKALESRVEKKLYEDEKGMGGGISLGLAEVSLPLEFKLKNIEETEAAKRKMLETRKARKLAKTDDETPTLALGNASTRAFLQIYDPDHSQFAPSFTDTKAKVTPVPTVGGAVTNTRLLPRGVEKRSDDIVVDRFLKRERQHFHK